MDDQADDDQVLGADPIDDDLIRRIRACVAHLGNETPGRIPAPRRRRGAGVLRAAAAVVVLALIAVVAVLFVQSDDEVSAVTPGLLRFDPIDTDAGELFEQAALAALSGTDTDGVLWVQQELWRFDVTVGAEVTDVGLRSTVQESWVRRDGTGEVRWWPGRTLDAGEVGGVFVPPDTSGEPELTSPYVVVDVDLRDAVPDDADAIVTLEDLGITGDDSEFLSTVSGLLRQNPLTGAQQAALWRSLATVEAIEVRGTTTDRFGREAVGVAVPSFSSGIRSQTIFLFDPATGTALATELVLTGDSRSLDIPTPALVEYSVVVERAVVDDVGDRPGD